MRLFKGILAAIRGRRNEEFGLDALRTFLPKHRYNYPLLSALLLCLGRRVKDVGRKADIVDFGGSLGVSWFQNHTLLDGFLGRYGVVEQKCVADLGRAEVPEVEFFYTIEECLAAGLSRDVCVLSSVLQYLDDPLRIVDEIIDAGFCNVIVDRGLFATKSVPPRIAIQYLRGKNTGQYPISIMERKDVLSKFLTRGYSLVSEWESFDVMPVKVGCRAINLQSQGFLVSRECSSM